MNIYFEFNETQIGAKYSNFGGRIPAKYCVRHCVTDLPGGPLYPHRLMFSAERIWQEDDNGVKFIKHRSAYLKDAVVDMKEFMWIKLSAAKV